MSDLEQGNLVVGCWGRGIYLAVNASYSNDYAYYDKDNEYRSMFLSNVFVGNNNTQHRLITLLNATKLSESFYVERIDLASKLR